MHSIHSRKNAWCIKIQHESYYAWVTLSFWCFKWIKETCLQWAGNVKWKWWRYISAYSCKLMLMGCQCTHVQTISCGLSLGFDLPQCTGSVQHIVSCLWHAGHVLCNGWSFRLQWLWQVHTGWYILQVCDISTMPCSTVNQWVVCCKDTWETPHTVKPGISIPGTFIGDGDTASCWLHAFGLPRCHEETGVIVVSWTSENTTRQTFSSENKPQTCTVKQNYANWISVQATPSNRLWTLESHGISHVVALYRPRCLKQHLAAGGVWQLFVAVSSH